jgi:translocation and assembly module TamB
VFANHEAQLNDIRMQAQNGVVTGSAAYNLASKTGHFDLVGDSVDLAEIPELQAARFTTAGTINFTAKGSGSLENPVITAHLQASNLVLNGELAGGLVADAVTHGSKLQLTARSQFPLATLSLDGTVDLKGDLPSDLTLQFDHLDIDPFLRTEMRGRITGHSVMAGQAHLAGPLRAPDKLNGILRVDAFKVEVEKIPLASEGPIELSMSNQVITVQHLVLTSEDSRFTASGTADLKGDRPMNLQAKGHINLKLAQTIDPDLTTYGTTEVDLKIDGTMAQPVMTGHMEIAHGGASMIDLPAGLGDVNGSFTFSQNRVEVERLSGRAGGGLVNFTGYITFGRTIGFDLNAKGNEIRFRYAGVSVTSDQELRLLGTLESATLNGDITVTRFAQIPSADLTQALAQVGGPAQSTNQRSPLNNLHLDVRILSAPELTVQTSLAKLSGDVDLRLRGTPIRPVLLGRINIAEGDIKLNGAKYHLERGDITFADPVRIDPILDVEATTSVRDYDITVGLHGTFEKLNTTYRSDPPLSSDDIIALLAFGRTEQEASTTGGGIPQVGFAESASNAVLGQAINAAAGNRVSKLFGVSSIKINPSVGGPDNNPNARLTVEQQVSNNITITYITNLAQSAQQVIQFEYNINRQYTILGTRDENGVLSMDLLIRQRRK